MKLIVLFSLILGLFPDQSVTTYTSDKSSPQDPITYKFSSTPIACNGSLSVQSLTVFGGAPPYTVTNQGGGVLASGLQSGVVCGGNTYAANYTYTITDSKGATKVFEAKIPQPDPIVEKFSFTPIKTKGGLSVQTLTVTGGTPPYKIVNQSGGVYMDGAQSGVSYSGNTYAASYTYTITDANKCTKVFSVTIPDGK